MKAATRQVLSGLMICLLAWLVVASIVYRFRHPEMTETELFLKLPDALLFRP